MQYNFYHLYSSYIMCQLPTSCIKTAPSIVKLLSKYFGLLGCQNRPSSLSQEKENRKIKSLHVTSDHPNDREGLHMQTSNNKFPFSDMVTSDCKSPSHDLTSTKPGNALQPKQSCYTSVLHLQLLPVLQHMLQMINFLPE